MAKKPRKPKRCGECVACQEYALTPKQAPICERVLNDALWAAKYWGAECEANPGSTFHSDYSMDIALKVGCGEWGTVPYDLKQKLFRAFNDGKKSERSTYK